jgi:two-component system CheB/CheR fusion protein
VTVRVEIVIEPITSVLRTGGLFLVVFRDLPKSTEHPFAPDEGGGEWLTGQPPAGAQDTRRSSGRGGSAPTASEEHSASYEELLALNEELQSSNEEIEASQEELQSLNEELTTMNRQLRKETKSCAHHLDLNNLLVSANVATIFPTASCGSGALRPRAPPSCASSRPTSAARLRTSRCRSATRAC